MPRGWLRFYMARLTIWPTLYILHVGQRIVSEGANAAQSNICGRDAQHTPQELLPPTHDFLIGLAPPPSVGLGPHVARCPYPKKEGNFEDTVLGPLKKLVKP
jgi:hypothetical protein